jgi:hypothetical protein
VRKLYVCGTEAGPIYIVLTEGGQFHPYYNGETLGAYSSPDQAVDEIIGGHTFASAAGLDPATLQIPNDLADWERC